MERVDVKKLLEKQVKLKTSRTGRPDGIRDGPRASGPVPSLCKDPEPRGEGISSKVFFKGAGIGQKRKTLPILINNNVMSWLMR